jgi:multiple sugar transport system ATP-binding protein
MGEPAIYVTHDQEEAMTMSDRIIVMNDGTIEQIGTADEVYWYPNNVFVAEFIGNPSMNFFECSLVSVGGDSVTIEIEGARIEFPIEGSIDGARGDVTLGVRPQHVAVEGDGARAFTGTVRLIEPLDDRSLATIDGPQGELSALIARDNDLTEGDDVDVYVNPAELHLFAPETTELIARGTPSSDDAPPRPAVEPEESG